MNVVILAGGRGTRIGEATAFRPKPMIEIGGKPLLWHLMRVFAGHGFSDFIVASGWKGGIIKRYFRALRGSAWKVTVVDTGRATMTGGRLLRLKQRLGREPFMLTYGDGLADVDLKALLRFHRRHGRLATVTAVHPPSRFGELAIRGRVVRVFSEKPQTGAGWINGGFFIFEPGIFSYLKDDSTVLERGPLGRLAARGQLMAFRHAGFWQPMDTIREKNYLERVWAARKAPWRTWR